MTETRDSTRRVDMGGGAMLYLPNSAYATLNNRFGEGYFAAIENGLLTYDMHVIQAILDVGYRSDVTSEIIQTTIDDPNLSMPLVELQEKMLDAFTLGASGRTYQAQLEFMSELKKKIEAEQRPPAEGPGAFLESSEKLPSEQD